MPVCHWQTVGRAPRLDSVTPPGVLAYTANSIKCFEKCGDFRENGIGGIKLKVRQLTALGMIAA